MASDAYEELYSTEYTRMLKVIYLLLLLLVVV